MTLQEMFDTMVLHLRTQGRKAVRYDPVSLKNQCVYRAADGGRCAVGCLITDAHYGKRLENQTVRSLPLVMALINSGIDMYDTVVNALLFDMQVLHDKEDVGSWEMRFRSIAKDFDLVVPPRVEREAEAVAPVALLCHEEELVLA